MELSTRTQNAIVAGLAAVAVSASAFAVWSVNRPHPSLSESAPSTAAAPGGDGADSTSPTDDDEASDERTATPTDEPSESSGKAMTGDSTATDESTAVEASVDSWVDAWSDESALLVIGDGYSNLPTQWVQLWGSELGEDRPVTIHHWGEAQDVTYNDPIVLSEEDGPGLTIWSASRDGTTIVDAAERVTRFAEEAGDVDAVLVSLGLDSEDEDVADSLDELISQVDEIDQDLPVLVAVAPPELYEPGVADEILAWSQENDDRVSVLELGPKSPDDPTAEEWAAAFHEAISES